MFSKLTSVNRPSYSPVHRLGLLVLFGGLIYAIMSIAYGWSLSETERMMGLIVGPDWQMVAALIIQFGPQPFLIISGMTKEPGRGRLNWGFAGFMFAAAILLNLVDTATNITAFSDWYGQGNASVSPEIRVMARWIGYILCFTITWAEEVSLIILAAGLEILRQLYVDLGKVAPRWMTWDLAQNIAAAGSGSRPQREEAPPRDNSHRREQPQTS